MTDRAGRDPVDDIDYRLDQGPPVRPTVTFLLRVKLDRLLRIIKKILRIRKC